MPGRGGDNDAGGMVWGSMIGKKLFGKGGLPSMPGLAPGGAARARGLACARSCPGAGGQAGSISAWQVCMIALCLRLLLAAICKRRRTNPTTEITEITEDAQRAEVHLALQFLDLLCGENVVCHWL
jgi:hypothetical protein